METTSNSQSPLTVHDVSDERPPSYLSPPLPVRLPHIEPPQFTGELGDDVNVWINEMENIFILYGVDEDFKSRFASVFLTGSSETTYANILHQTKGTTPPWLVLKGYLAKDYRIIDVAADDILKALKNLSANLWNHFSAAKCTSFIRHLEAFQRAHADFETRLSLLLLDERPYTHVIGVHKTIYRAIQYEGIPKNMGCIYQYCRESELPLQ
jgi:hypothetical protein